uniref:FCPI-2 n=1 Tax=Chaetoceros neogracilis TaxID=240364 RepID=UPI00186589B2|nr:Chain U, FCPI-2 [Chaetoceros gracilis]
LDGMVGTSVETGGKIFDPLNLSDYIPADRARAAELANGRSAMLATVGYVFPKWFGHFEGDVSVDDPIAAIGQADPQWWAQFIIFCGTIEAYKYRMELEGKSSTGGGEPAIDWMKMYPKDEAGRRDMELKELKNGRLAMLGIAGFVSAHFIPGAVPIGPGF